MDQSIQMMDNPAGIQSELPFLFADDTGKIYLSWVEPGAEEDETVHYYSSYDGNGWVDPHVIAKSNSWFVNWADYPSLVANSGKALAAHELYKIPGSPYSYNVHLRFNKNGSWKEPITPHFDSTATEHGFVSLYPLSNEEVFAIWLDGRQTHDRTDQQYFDLDKAMTLRSATIHASGEVTQKQLVDSSVCDCCQTSLARTGKGMIAAYRNRTDEEIRDIYVSRYQQGKWSDPEPVHNDNWKIGACPVNGPKITADGSIVLVAWYTSAQNTPMVKASISRDYGETFEQPVIIEESKTIGRVDVAIGADSSFYVSRIGETPDGGHALKVSRISPSSKLDTTYAIAPMNSSRSSGFPQMELSDNMLYFAWTDIVDDSTHRILTASMEIQP
ncbi:MAG: hypothetical protein R3222_03690 [Balneolaceae bacterium]|nr:hypothetical protein [Balneolaceae bacterium]